MGSDDLFKKSKKCRKEKVRQAKEKYWFFCEGETEQEYLNGMRRTKRVPKELWCIQAITGEPKRLYDKATRAYHRESKPDKPQKIYLIFDRDEHAHFYDVLTKSRTVSQRSRGRVPIQVIASYPCWEVWVLCHFEDNKKPWMRAGTQSACDSLMAHIKRTHLSYGKNDPDLFAKLLPKLHTAIAHAKKLRTHHEQTATHNPTNDEPNPSTDMDKLLEDFAF